MADPLDFGALKRALEEDWPAKARPEQLPPPGDWLGHIILAGRGWGKTRTGAEWIRSLVESGQARRIALVGSTTADVRDVMVEGNSGLLSISPAWNMPTYEPSKRGRLTWPNGAVAMCFSAEEPSRLRGPQFDAAWCDELAAWSNPDATWDMLMFGLRLGTRPRVLVTTTPRPIPIVKSLLKRSDFVVTRGSTRENAANLAATFLATVSRYVGTRLGRQELEAEILEDSQGALWTLGLIDRTRIAPSEKPGMTRIVVAVDPAVSNNETSDETGIIVCGLGENGHGYVLHDGSGRFSPTEWASIAVGLYHRYGADRVVAETNQGGDLVENTLRMVDPNVAYRGVHASKGKIVRAEPVSALYEQGRVHHVGTFPTLEDQLTTFEPGSRKSPDRLDALVYAITELMVGANTIGMIDFYRGEVERSIADGTIDPPPAASGYSFAATPRAGLVRLIVPPGFSTIMLLSGEVAAVDRDGVLCCREADAKPLRAIGFRDAPATIEHEAAS